MKKLILSLLTLAAILTASSCGNNRSKDESSDSAVNTTADSLSTYDSATMVTDATDTSSNYLTTFTLKAGSGGLMEVQLGNLAQKNAQNPRVKAFGAMMVKDHSKANKELMTIAANKSISIPSALSAEHQKHVDEMAKLKGTDFDKHYMDMMTKDHREDVDLFEKAAKNLNDADLKAFASKTLPVLNMHLDSAKAIKDAIK
jgi:putative membrane protein